jgi:two-component system sensor kinase FixL
MTESQLVEEVKTLRARVAELDTALADCTAGHQAVADQRDLLHSIVEETTDAVFVKGGDGRYIMCNAATGKAFGSPVDGIVGRLDSDLFDAETTERIRAIDRRILSSGVSETYEQELANGGNEARTYSIYKWPRRDRTGGIIGLIGIARDVTAAKQAYKALQQSEEQYRTLQQNLPVGIWRTTPDGRALSVNAELVRMYGYESEQEVLNTPIDSFWPESGDRKAFKERLETSGFVSGLEYRQQRKDGSIIWVSSSIRVARDEQGEVFCYDGIDIDITERRRAEEALERARAELEDRVRERTAELTRANEQLRRESAVRRHAEQEARESEERFRQLSDAAFEGVAIHESGKIIDGNLAIAAMFGCSPEDLVGKTRVELVAPESRDSTRESLRRHTLSGDERGWETVGVRADGTTFPIEVRDKSIPYHGRMVRVTTVRDITDRKAAEEQARRHQAELAHVLRFATMGEMAAGIAHEVNQPLAAIANYTRGCIIRLQSDRGDRKELLEAMRLAAQQAERAGKIIHRLRHLVGGRRPERTPVDINELVQRSIDYSELDIQWRGVTASLELAPDLPIVQVDPIQIEQVVLNLMRNAVEAMSSPGTLTREMVIRTAAVGQGTVDLMVCDTGPGVPDEVRERVFDQFMTTKIGGLGMGLSISRSIAEAHGGKLRVEPNPGGGAVFRLTLPLDGGDDDEAG